jgi:hypothetical protein
LHDLTSRPGFAIVEHHSLVVSTPASKSPWFNFLVWDWASWYILWFSFVHLSRNSPLQGL